MKGVNNVKRTIAPNQVFPEVSGLVDATISWKQGDLLWFDNATDLVKPITALAHGIGLLGIALQSVTLGVQDGPYTGLTDTSPSANALAGPMFGLECEMILQTGDTVAKGDIIYNTASATIVSNVAGVGAKAVGVYTGNLAIAGAAAGTKILVHVGSRYPEDVLRL